MENLNFNYYYGSQAEQFSFYRIPKLLFTDEFFDKISSDAKILYGVMLDRMSLSMKNGWVDKENRVYIIFTIDDVREMMRCGEQKAVKLLAELDSVNGIGLIEKKRQGLGKPNLIYVKNFVRNIEQGQVCEFQNCENEEFKNNEDEQIQNSENAQFKSCDDEELQNNEYSQFNNFENHSSRIVNITVPELLKSQSNNTNINNTDFSNQSISNLSKSEVIEMDMMDRTSEEEKLRSNTALYSSAEGRSVSKYMRYIRQQIDYDCLVADFAKDEIDEIVDLMIETICIKRDTIWIAGAEQPYELVKSKFMKLNAMHIRYVIDCMKENRTKVRNIKNYMLTALFNSSSTINMYYQAKVNSGNQD
ncbi:MAG: replication initiator protein A [Clostridiales bacterium]|nr:replication initiator protein A [Clostridiales bacterium]